MSMRGSAGGCWLAAALLATSAHAAGGDVKVVAQSATESAAADASRVSLRPVRPVLRYGLDYVRLEYGALPYAPRADSQATLTTSGFVLWQPDRDWELRAGVRLDSVNQAGGADAFTRWRGDVGDTYVRYRSGNARVTFGAQAIIWGRVDEVPLSDRVSRADLTRFVLDDLADRRRATFALRWEQSIGDYKLDAVAMPQFRPAVLPDLRSVWSPIDQVVGRVFGIPDDPAFAAFVRSADVVRSRSNTGGGALRLTRAGVPPFDFGLTVARSRQSLPYYRADFVAGELVEIHPVQNFVGADAELVVGDVTWRAEVGHTRDVPLTQPSGELVFGNAWEWVGAAEFFPGGRDVRVNLQLLLRHARSSSQVLERTHYVGVNGEVEATFAQGRWRLGVRFASGLNAHDVYLAPKLTYLGWEPHEFYIVGRYFDGDERSLGGFHRDHRMLAVGVRTRF